MEILNKINLIYHSLNATLGTEYNKGRLELIRKMEPIGSMKFGDIRAQIFLLEFPKAIKLLKISHHQNINF